MLVYVMAWGPKDHKPLAEPMLAYFTNVYKGQPPKLTYCDQNKMATILEMKFSNAFSSVKIILYLS